MLLSAATLTAAVMTWTAILGAPRGSSAELSPVDPAGAHEAGKVTPDRRDTPPHAGRDRETPDQICAGKVTLQARLQGQLDYKLGQGGQVDVHVEFKKGQGIEGRVRLVPAGEHPFERTFQGKTCDEVIQALAFSFEIYLDQIPPGEREPIPCQPLVDQHESPPDIDPFSLPPAGPRVVPTAPAWPRPTALGMGYGLVSVGWGQVPTPSVGLSFGARVRVADNTLAGLEVEHHQGGPVVASSGPYAFGASSVTVHWTQMVPLGGPAKLGIAVGPRATFLHVTWSDTSPAMSQHGTMGLLGMVEVGAEFGPAWMTGIRLSALFHMVRARFVGQDGSLIWEQPWAGGQLGWYFGANFW